MPIDSNLALSSLAELSRLIKAKTISPVELTQAYLDRIEMLDPRLHSFNCVRQEALSEAKVAEQSIINAMWRGPLHGIPLGIKDLIDVAGVPTTAQSAHRKNAVAMQDSGVVEALKQAGAIILGKQATAEYAVGGTQFNLPWPAARNPWNLDLDPSSSSCGSAIAVAAGLCAGSVGTETAGSIRAPAAWCGVAGLKPTDRLVSRKGVLPISRTMDCLGPLAWTVEDCALMLMGMISNDGEDKETNGFHAPDISDLAIGIRGLRVGVVRHFYENDPDIDPEIYLAMDQSLDILTRLGAQLTTVRLADFNLYSQVAKNITWPEEYAEHGTELRDYPDRFGSVTRSRLQDGKNVSAPDYINALRQQANLVDSLRDIMRDVDVLVLPTMKKPAQILGYEATAKVDLSLNRPFNLTGNPALCLCNGFTATGLPLSIQIIGRHFEDGTVLRAGHALEQALNLRDRRPAIALI